jgi:SAM-dependent methyltransferase
MHRTLVLSLRLVIRPFLFLLELATDAWLGVDTRARADSESAIKDLALGGDPEDYEPVNLLWWMRMFSAVPLDPTQTTFVDLGAGRGRELILAARMGFRRVIGVELDERLASDAESNIARWSSRGGANRKNQEVRVLHSDAASFTMPAGRLVVSLFNPFGAETLRRVLTSLSTQPRPVGDEVYIAYFNPVQEHVFEDFPEFVRADGGVDWALYGLVTAARGGGVSPVLRTGGSGRARGTGSARHRSVRPPRSALPPVRPCPIRSQRSRLAAVTCFGSLAI